MKVTRATSVLYLVRIFVYCWRGEPTITLNYAHLAFIRREKRFSGRLDYLGPLRALDAVTYSCWYVTHSLTNPPPTIVVTFLCCAAVNNDELGVHRSVGRVHGNVGPTRVVRVFGAAAVLPVLVRFRRAVFGANFHRGNEFSVGVRLRHRLRGAGELHACTSVPYCAVLHCIVSCCSCMWRVKKSCRSVERLTCYGW